MAIGGLIAERLAPSAPERPGRGFALRTTPIVAARHWLAERVRGEMPSGAVVYHAPSTAFQSPGGGENQLIQTGRYLEARGVAVRPFSPWVDRLDRASLLHLFGMSREGPATGPRRPSEGGGRSSSRRSAGSSRGRWPRWRPISSADGRIGPNGGSRRSSPGSRPGVASCWGSPTRSCPTRSPRGEQLIRWFGADPDRIRPVPNGVEERFAHADPSAFRAIHGPGEFVLYVGRIEPRKNVLGLVEGVRAAGLPLVVIGDALPGYEGYAADCQRAGAGFARWLPRVDHDDPLLESAYASARVLALPSWFETPGLVALEAALAGTAVVITPHGCTHEYFGDRVGYARPDRPSEIARAIADAWQSGPDPGLAAHVGSHYPWSEVARRTAEAYDQVTR